MAFHTWRGGGYHYAVIMWATRGGGDGDPSPCPPPIAWRGGCGLDRWLGLQAVVVVVGVSVVTSAKGKVNPETLCVKFNIF